MIDEKREIPVQFYSQYFFLLFISSNLLFSKNLIDQIEKYIGQTYYLIILSSYVILHVLQVQHKQSLRQNLCCKRKQFFRDDDHFILLLNKKKSTKLAERQGEKKKEVVYYNCIVKFIWICENIELIVVGQESTKQKNTYKKMDRFLKIIFRKR